MTIERNETVRGLALTLLVLAAVPLPCSAQWATSPTLTVETSWQENPRFQSGNDAQASGAALNFDTLFARTTPTSSVSLRPRLRSSVYTDAQDLESTDRFFDFSLERRGQKSGWSLATQLAADTTLVTELGTTGILDTSRRQELAGLRSSFYRSVSARTRIGAELRAEDVDYRDTLGTDLVDYSYQSLAVVSRISASERARVNFSLRSGELEATELAIRQRDHTLTIGVEHDLGAVWSMSVDGGPARVEARNGDTDSGMLLGLSAEGRGQRLGTSVSFVRSLLPTGRGVVSRRDRLLLSLSRPLSARSSVQAVLQRIETEDVVAEAAVGFEDRAYRRAELRFDYRFGTHWDAAVAAVWADQEIGPVLDADQQQAIASFTWRGRPAAAR